VVSGGGAAALWATPIPPSGSRLLLIRHAEPVAEAAGRCYGRLDVGLSPRGHAQAAALADALGGAPLAGVYSSPRLRARDTASPLARRLAQGHAGARDGAGAPAAEVVIDDLREIDFGRFEGLTYAAAAELDPDAYERWMARPTEVAFPGGESYPALRDRVRAAAAAIRAVHPGACAAIVAHGGTVRTVLAEALGLPDAHIFRLDVAHASISAVDHFGDGTPIVRLVNAQL
jgi:alpha-ribazole phosphatase/probable phosphoglycerate mutase